MAIKVSQSQILEVFPDLVIDPLLQQHCHAADYINGFDHSMHPVMVASRKDNRRHLAAMMWGLLPPWVKNMEEAHQLWNGGYGPDGKFKPGITTLNAVGEEMLGRPMYKDAALRRRCIVFADGFYEWHHHYPVGRKGTPLKTAVKYPHYITLKDRSVPFMMMGGIWQPWKNTFTDTATGEVKEEVVPTFAIVTTRANELMRRVHNSKQRMPLMFTPAMAADWIRNDLPVEAIREMTSYQYPSENLVAHSIAKDFQQLPQPQEPFHYAEWPGIDC